MHFPRPELAKKMADVMQNNLPFSSADGGLFLAAPRRTGKTVFLREDLIPELRNRGTCVVYVDLWTNKEQDASALIAEAISKAILEHSGTLSKAAQKSGLTGIEIPGIGNFDLSKIGKPQGTTLHEALELLHRLSKSNVALIIDEAQQALASQEGMNAMFSIKAARDQMNAPGKTHLLLAMSGSDRDKLLRLVNGNSAPFMGSTVAPMPLLGLDFVDFVINALTPHLPLLANLDAAKLFPAFEMSGHRPQVLSSIIQSVDPFGTSASADALLSQILTAAQAYQNDELHRMESDFLGLSPLEQAVFVCMLERGSNYKPYGKTEMDFYGQYTHRSWSVPSVQQAIDRLRNMDEPLIWKSSRGEYAVESGGAKEWKKKLESLGEWPPVAHQPPNKRSKKKPS